MENREDLPLTADIAEIKRELQREVDNNIDLRARLDASNKRLAAMDSEIDAGIADARAFLHAYLNPSVPNPVTPIAPEVAAPAPAEEPPVFTTVDSPELSHESTSGGFAEIIAEAFDVPEIAAEQTPANDAPASEA